jgi:hypothetical protein
MPSKTRPSMRIRSPWSAHRQDAAEVVLEDVEAGRCGARPMWTYGPAVCDAVSRRPSRAAEWCAAHCALLRGASARVLEQRRALAAQDDVEAVGAAVELDEGARSCSAIRPRICSSLGATPRIGQLRISGSPSKYICVISRCTQPSPEIA